MKVLVVPICHVTSEGPAVIIPSRPIYCVACCKMVGACKQSISKWPCSALEPKLDALSYLRSPKCDTISHEYKLPKLRLARWRRTLELWSKIDNCMKTRDFEDVACWCSSLMNRIKIKLTNLRPGCQNVCGRAIFPWSVECCPASARCKSNYKVKTHGRRHMLHPRLRTWPKPGPVLLVPSPGVCSIGMMPFSVSPSTDMLIVATADYLSTGDPQQGFESCTCERSPQATVLLTSNHQAYLSLVASRHRWHALTNHCSSTATEVHHFSSGSLGALNATAQLHVLLLVLDTVIATSIVISR